MPVAFDCHDQVGGFDCKILIDAFDVYGPPSAGWVQELADATDPICITSTGGSVVIITATGDIYTRVSSGVWTKIESGCSGVGRTAVGTEFSNYPLLASHGGAFYFVRYSGAFPYIYSVTSGGSTAENSSNDPLLAEGCRCAVGGTGALHWFKRQLSGSIISGASKASGGSWSWETITNVVTFATKWSDATISGMHISPSGWATGTTTLYCSGLHSGSGYPSGARQIATYSGVAYAIQTGGYSIQYLPDITTGWRMVTGLRKTGGVDHLGSSIAHNGHIYYSYRLVSGIVYTMIDDFDIAAGTIVESSAYPQVRSTVGKFWFTKSATSIYFVGDGYILRKDF